jgi:hypothetical protein
MMATLLAPRPNLATMRRLTELLETATTLNHDFDRRIAAGRKPREADLTAFELLVETLAELRAIEVRFPGMLPPAVRVRIFAALRKFAAMPA